MKEKIKSLMIIGQTCSGKENLSLKLAEHFNTEIISMDSMKIYKDMNIGTAKATLDARQRVIHHLIDIITPEESYNVSEYIRDVIPIASKMALVNKIPLFSGGTPLYAKSLISGLFSSPEIPLELKQKIEIEYDTDKEKVYQKLLTVDPVACKKIHLNDRQRVTRALEVYEATNKPISSFQNQFSTTSDSIEFLSIGLRWPREILHKRIKQRVYWMLDAGLEEEVRNINLKYPQLGSSAKKAVGYYEWIPYFNGECSKESVIERIVINTRQLCKHQMTWMKKIPIEWIDVDSTLSDTAIFEKSIQLIQNSFLKNYLT